MANHEILDGHLITSVTTLTGPASYQKGIFEGLENQHHHHLHHDSDSGTDSEKSDESEDEEEMNLYRQHCESKKKKLKKRFYRNHEATYLAHNIEKLHGLHNHKHAVIASLLRACKKRYNIVGSETDYNFAVTLAALILDPNCEHSALTKDQKRNTKLLLTIFGDFSTEEFIADYESHWHQHNESEIHIRFRGEPVEISKTGKYELEAIIPEEFSNKDPHIPVSGIFDIDSTTNLVNQRLTQQIGNRIVYRIKLFNMQKRTCIADMNLPSCELHCILKVKGNSRYLLEQVKLIVNLSPAHPGFMDERNIIPCGTNPLLPYSHHQYGYASEEECQIATPVTSPFRLEEALETIIKQRLGQEQYCYRLVGHLGRKHLVSVGKEHNDYFFHLGQCSEMFTCVALIEHLKDVILKSGAFGREVDFHDPKLTEFVLHHHKAHNILNGLKKAYKNVGDGRIPSIYHLLTHQSGLPEYLPVHVSLVDHFLRSGSGQTSSEELRNLEILAGSNLEAIEKILGEHIGEFCVPICTPGAKHHQSKLGYAVLRFMFADWHLCGQISAINNCFRALGCQTAIQNQIDPMRLAPHCPKHREPFVRGQNEMPLYHTSCGFSARIDELAHFLSDNNPWKLIQNSPQHNGPYGFLPHLLVQKCCINKHAAIHGGYGGWMHAGIFTKSFMDGKKELRILCNIGNTPGHHTVIMCMVPALSISFAFGCNAELAMLLDEHHSILDFVTQIVGTMLEHSRELQNSNNQPARFFNHLINSQLSISPPVTSQAYTYQRKCAQKMAILIGQPQEDLQLKKDFCGQEFVCLTEDNNYCGLISSSSEERREPSQSNTNFVTKISVSYVTTEAPPQFAYGEKNKMTGYLLKERRVPFGDETNFMLAFDSEAFHRNSDAEEAFAAVERNFPFDARKCGVYRRIDPHDTLLSEPVQFSMVSFNAKKYDLDGKSMVANFKEPVITTNGRIFVRPQFYDIIRKCVSPNLQEQAHSSLARNFAGKQSPSDSTEDNGYPVGENPTDVFIDAVDSTFAQYALVQSATQNNLISEVDNRPVQKRIGSILKKINSPEVTPQKSIGHGFHVAANGGATAFSQGYRWGLGAGLGMGLAYNAAVYPWVGPVYPYAPYYNPWIYGPYRYRYYW